MSQQHLCTMPHIQIQVLLSMKNNCRNLCNTDTQQAVLSLQLEINENVSKSYHKHNSMQVKCKYRNYVHSNVHIHTFNGPFSGNIRWAGTRRVKSIWILLKQKTVSRSGISGAICKSAPSSGQITTPAPNHSVFTARCYASVVLAMGLCLCLSQVGVLLKQQNVGSHKQHHTIPQGL